MTTSGTFFLGRNYVMLQRGYSTRLTVVIAGREVKAVQLIQRMYRDFKHREELGDAATKIESIFRGSVARQNTSARKVEMKGAVAELERAWKSYHAKKGYMQHEAARSIQSKYRGHRVRQDRREAVQASHAATAIQSGWRGTLGRRDAAFKLVC